MGDLKRGVKSVWDDVIEGSRQIGERIGIGSISGQSKNTKRKLQGRKPKAIPLADEDALRKARRDSFNNMRARSGRMSTLLSDNNEKLGG